MRYRLMATYRGVPYEAGIGPSEADVVLFAACPPPEELGFEPATGHWRKQLRIDQVQALWESRPTGMFRGQRCIVLDDLGDRLHIAYLGHDAYQAEQLGYWQVDRGVFELITPRDDVIDIVEERTDYPGQADDVPPPRGAEFGAQPLGAAVPGPADLSFAALPTAASRQDAAAPRQDAAAPRQDAAATKLADLAAATLAHLATMSNSASRASGRTAGSGRRQGEGPVLSPGTDHGGIPGDDPAGPTAQDPPQRPADPLTGPAGGPSNGMATHPAEFPGSAVPGRWRGAPPGSEVAMPPHQAEPLPLEAAARRAASAATAAMRRQRRDQATERRGRTPQPEPEPAVPEPAAADPEPAAAAPPQAEAARPQAEAAPPQAEAAPPPGADTQPQADAAPQADTAPQPEAAPQADAALQPEAVPQPGAAAAPQPTAPAPEPRGAAPAPSGAPRRRRTTRKRDATQRIFSELASLAAIPPAAYAVGAEVDGAMCLIQGDQGFEVFNAVSGARHEIRSFQDEESAYFYLFGVLAADAVRTGRLAPRAD